MCIVASCVAADNGIPSKGDTRREPIYYLLFIDDYDFYIQDLDPCHILNMESNRNLRSILSIEVRVSDLYGVELGDSACKHLL